MNCGGPSWLQGRPSAEDRLHHPSLDDADEQELAEGLIFFWSVLLSRLGSRVDGRFCTLWPDLLSRPRCANMSFTNCFVLGDWSSSSVTKRACLQGLYPRGWNFSSTWTASSDWATQSISSTRLCPWAATCTLSSWLSIPRRNWSTTISSLAW